MRHTGNHQKVKYTMLNRDNIKTGNQYELSVSLSTQS